MLHDRRIFRDPADAFSSISITVYDPEDASKTASSAVQVLIRHQNRATCLHAAKAIESMIDHGWCNSLCRPGRRDISYRRRIGVMNIIAWLLQSAPASWHQIKHWAQKPV